MIPKFYLLFVVLVNFQLLSDLSSKKRKQLSKNETWLCNFLLCKLTGLVQACTSAKKLLVDLLMERIFSGGRDTISLRRASLQPETIRTLMLVKQRLRLSCDVVK
jgi:hypothetical protein